MLFVSNVKGFHQMIGSQLAGSSGKGTAAFVFCDAASINSFVCDSLGNRLRLHGTGYNKTVKCENTEEVIDSNWLN